MNPALPDLEEQQLFLDLLRAGHEARMRAYGLSMLPRILPGTELTIAPPPFDPPLARGDVVLTCVNDKLRVHRVIAIEGANLYCTKGDSSPFVDPVATRDMVAGRVVRVGERPAAHLRGELPRIAARALAGISGAQGHFTRKVARVIRRARSWKWT